MSGSPQLAAGSTMADRLGEDPMSLDRLVPELRIATEEIKGLGPCLRHPLVYQVPFFSWKLANDTLTHKEQLIIKLTGEEDYERILWLYERPHRLSMLWEWTRAGLVDEDSLRALLPGTWMGTEFPRQYKGVPLRLFRKAGWVTDAEGLERPDYGLTVYRGTIAGSKLGIAWTKSPAVAAWFATRLAPRNRTPIVYEGWIDGGDVLAVFTSKDEAEVVADPKRIRDIRVHPDNDLLIEHVRPGRKP